MKLNLGCEACVLPIQQWDNIDHKSVRPQVIEHDCRKGLNYPPESVDEVYGGHFFDHLTYFEGLALLKECYRVLKPGGVVHFSVMDTDTIINSYLLHRMEEYENVQPPIFKTYSNATKFATFLLGNLANEKEYTGHKMLFSPQSLQEIFAAAGFQAKIIEPDFSVEPWCVEKEEYYDHTLYVEGIK